MFWDLLPREFFHAKEGAPDCIHPRLHTCCATSTGRRSAVDSQIRGSSLEYLALLLDRGRRSVRPGAADGAHSALLWPDTAASVLRKRALRLSCRETARVRSPTTVATPGRIDA